MTAFKSLLRQTHIDDAGAAIRSISLAADACAQAKGRRDVDSTAAAELQLLNLVQAAIEGGMSWQSVGDILGLARGNAYQRYRRRHQPLIPHVDTPPLERPPASPLALQGTGPRSSPSTSSEDYGKRAAAVG
jgi:hypothetical protein